MKYKTINFILVAILLVSVFVVPASAKTQSKTQALTYTYYDSLITSIKIGRIKSTYVYSYDTATNKLVNEKSISHATSNVKIGCKFKDINKYWSWYNTSSKNGTGRGITEWSFGIGITTQWITLGSFQDDWMALTPKGNGSWSSSFS